MGRSLSQELEFMVYVFQYGSNTLSSRLNSETRLRGDARPIGAVYTEANFELDFDVWSDTNNCAVADIIRADRCE